MKISEAFEKHINFMKLKGRSFNYIKCYNRTKDSLIVEFGDKPVEQLTIDELCKWCSKVRIIKALSQNSQRLYVMALRQTLKYCQTLGVQCVNSALIPLPQRIPNVPNYLTPKEVKLLLKHSRSIKTKLIISLLYSSGLRVSELCSLNRGDIYDKQYTVMGKGKKIRVCFIDSRTEVYMKRYLEGRTDNERPLVVSKDGRRMTTQAVEGLVRRCASRAGLYNKKVTPHTLRHSFATNFLENNGNIRYLQELMGHANLATTQIYTHVSNTNLRDAYMKHHSY